jgi:hypothetical protein
MFPETLLDVRARSNLRDVVAIEAFRDEQGTIEGAEHARMPDR